MPRKDPEARREYEKMRYQRDKEKRNAVSKRTYERMKDVPGSSWKNEDGSWKQGGTIEQRRETRKRHYWKHREEILEAQRLKNKENVKVGKCPICEMENVRLVYDHCHKTGNHRGWICNSCNLMLGFGKDNPAILQKGIEYLLEQLV